VDTGFCNFTQRIEKGLMTALFEVRKLHPGTQNLTVQVMVSPAVEQNAPSLREIVPQFPIKMCLTLMLSRGGNPAHVGRISLFLWYRIYMALMD
jgi:hypothetical protein